ncbi:MAG TPA: molybdopterin dinucleotide binding domain-containing protein [Candidatus Binataceae bacterium]|nr:molybdopterin dinucleotide binding domain-containing protein [Candidatus Binataceae bacterium]
MPEVSRRSFLKLAAATGAAATIPGCKPAARHLIPYVIPDENVIPGVPSFYATSCNECPAGCGIVARVREGRVVKLEGNPANPIGAGALCARGQSALQGLYNPDRLRRPHRRGADKLINPIAWDDAMAQLGKSLAEASGADQVAFIGPPVGPAYEQIIGAWMAALNSRMRLVYAPIDAARERATIKYCFGDDLKPLYRIDRAQALLSLGADFLETWESPVELARQFAAFRTPARENGKARLGLAYYVGPRMSLTAARCDQWFSCRPGFEASVALAMLRVMVDKALVHPTSGIELGSVGKFAAGYDPAAIAEKSGVSAKTIERMAHEFAEADGALAIAGTDDDAAHVAAWMLNAVTGNIGKTVSFAASPQSAASSGTAAVLDAMRAGNIKVAVVAEANPQFSMPAQARFAEALSKVPLVVWCGGVPDETAQLAHLLLPTDHWLEDWGDGAPRPGLATLRQPTMTRVMYSRPLGDILLESARAAAPKERAPKFEDTQSAVRETWSQQFKNQLGAGSFDDFWDESLRQGGHFEQAKAASVKLSSELFGKPIELPEVPDQQPALTLVAYPHIFLYDGRGADKPWLQEIPEPVSQIVWDSWAEIHPDTAKRLGVAENDIVRIASSTGTIELPAHVGNFVHPDVIAVPIGQGHTSYGRYAKDRGANTWQALPPDRTTIPIKASPTGQRRELISPLFSADMLDRPLVETMSLADYQKGATPPAWEEPYPEPYETYPAIEYPVHEWGMTIDLNACTGCSACIAACYAENNVPFVGKELVAQGRIMSWIRLERYVPKTNDAPLLLTMPMLCQQCSHAPCEPVCPVFAAVHSNEGLNLQVYNRCIGTRYCNNNCPYKVRRFNWFKPQWPEPLNLQLNPDVTVRGAGVMEKCTFCVQRIVAGEVQAHLEDRKVRDGDIVPACAQACPSRAITFGDMKDKNSAMMKRRADHEIRNYKALDEPLNTLPAITYLRQVYRPRGEV